MTGPPLLLTTLLLWCAIASPAAAPLELPPLYEELEGQLVNHPWVGDRAAGYLIDYARHHGALGELRERWTRSAEREPKSAPSYHLMLGRLASEESPECAWSHLEKGGQTVYAHEARARWHVRHGTPEAAYRSLQEAQSRALSPSQWRHLTEALANYHFHRNERDRTLDVWRSAWETQDDFVYRMEVLPALWSWFNYLGETGAVENLIALADDKTERPLLLTEAARLSGGYDRAEHLLVTLAEEERQGTRALLVEKRLAESLGADRQRTMLSARLAAKSASFTAQEIHGVIGLHGMSNAVGPGITFAQRAAMRAFVNDICSTYGHVFRENPFLALSGQKRHPGMGIVHAHARAHPDDFETNFVALELAVEASPWHLNSDPRLIERRDALIQGYQRVFENAPRESSALRGYWATQNRIPDMNGDPWDKPTRFDIPIDLRQFASHGPLAVAIIDQIHVPAAEIPPQAASVQPFIQIASTNAFAHGQVDIASAALWQIPVEPPALPCTSIRVLPAPIANVALTHSRNRAAVQLQNNQLLVIDGTGDQLASRELPSRPAFIAFAGNEDAAPLCFRLQKSFLCWDWAAHGTLREIFVETDDRRTAFAPDGTAAAVIDPQGTLAVFKLPSLDLRWRKQVAGGRASLLSFSSDGEHLYHLENPTRAVPNVYSNDGHKLNEEDTEAYFREHADDPKDQFQQASGENLLEPFVGEQHPAFIRLLDPQGTPIASLSTVQLGALAEVWTITGENDRVHLLTKSGVLYHWEPDAP